MPISRSVRMTRTAISPRFATRTLVKRRRSAAVIGAPGGSVLPREPPCYTSKTVPEDRSLSFDFAPKAPKPAEEPPPPLTVAALDRAVREALETAFVSAVWVEGEV